MAEIAQQYSKKARLFSEGRIQSREWQDKEGQKHQPVVATNFRMLGGRGDGTALAPVQAVAEAELTITTMVAAIPEPMGGGGPEI